MAEDRIDSIVSQGAYKQLDDLTSKLELSQKALVDNIDAAIKLNTVLGNSKSLKDLEANNQKAAKAVENLNKVQAQTLLIETKVEAERQKISIKEEARINKQIALEAKKHKTIISNSQAEIEASRHSTTGNVKMAQAINETSKRQGEQANAAVAATVATKANTDATQKSNLTKKQQAFLLAEEKLNLQRSTAELKNQAREANSVKGSLEQRRAALIRLNAVYDNQSPIERASASGQRLQSIIGGLNTQVLTLEKTTGRSQRNVGNYGSALGKAYGFLRTAANLIPGAGISGLILIAFTGLQKIYDLYKKQGSVIGTNNDLNKLANNNYAEQITKVNILSREISRGNVSQNRSKEIIGELNEISPVYFNGLKTQSDLITKFPAAYDKYNQALILNSKIEAAKTLITEKYKRQLELQNEVLKVAGGDGDFFDKLADRLGGFTTVAGTALAIFGKGTQGAAAQASKEFQGLDKELGFLFKNLAENEDKLKLLGGDPDGKGFLKRKAELEKLAKLQAELAKKQDEALFALNQFRLKRTVEINKLTVDNEKSSLDDRLNALDDYIQNQNSLIKLEEKQSLKNIELTENDRIRIKEEAGTKIADLTREQYSLTQQILKDNLSKEDEIRLTANEKQLSILETQRDAELLVLNSRFSRGEIDQETYEQEKFNIQLKYNQLAIAAEIKHTEDFINIQKLRGLDTAEAEAKLAALKIKYSDETLNAELENLKKLEEREKELKDKRKELAQELFNLTTTLISAGFQRQSEQLTQESEQIDIKKAKEIESVDRSLASEQDKANRIAIINAKAQGQKEAIERRQRQLDIDRAKFDRAEAIAKIIVNTASAVAQALPNIPLSILIGAIGAAQLATALAAPIPKFKEGGKMGYTGLAEYGHGTELRIDPDGAMSLTGSKPEVGLVKKGTEFISNPELMRMLAKPDKMQWAGGMSIDMNKVIEATENSGKRVENAVYSLKQKSGGINYYSTSKGREYLKRNL